MRKLIIVAITFLIINSSWATIHTINVWDGYFQFFPSMVTVELGDTIQWRKFDEPMMMHTITSTTIPAGAASFDQVWQLPADTFFQYIPTVVGTYNYVCTPHETSHNMVGSFTVIEGTVGIDEQTGSDMLIYPNPTSGTLYFQNLEEGSTYRVIDNQGKVVLKGQVNNNLDVSYLKKGTYFLSLEGLMPRVLRFVKQ